MWVRIDEVAFDLERAGAVIDRTRNTAVGLHQGEDFRGFRLLVDRANGRGLDVSYWDTEAGARADRAQQDIAPDAPGATVVVRTNVYELAIDAC
ncbi:hypothetical protein [Pengzhenrongella phosphoraccumulans]|uniref:hypothetical protein n=1 Tax=Pengzhenrongella phosphoraccumulans TaxID=3114394 RepID=UPI00389112B6